MDYVQKQYCYGHASSHVLSTVGLNIVIANHRLVYGTRYIDPPGGDSYPPSIGNELGSAMLCGAIIPVPTHGRYAVIVKNLFAKQLTSGQPIYCVKEIEEPGDSDALKNCDDTVRTTLNPDDYLVGTIGVCNSPYMYNPLP